MKQTRPFVKNRKGINTILASLLMVVIVVVAAVMVYAWSTGLLGTLLVNPNNNKEGPLALDTNAAFPSLQNVTLYVRNSGSLSVQLTSFYITDSSNDIWQAISWTGPTIAPNTVSTITISIPNTTGGTTCNTNSGSGYSGTGCAYVAGSSTFTQFNAGSYTVKVITGRNNPFSFSITK